MVKAMATDSKGATSAWSSTLSVTISTTGLAPEKGQGPGQINNQEQQGQQGQQQNFNQNQGKTGNQGRLGPNSAPMKQ